MRNKLLQYNVTSIYHFTPVDNLPLIKKAGFILPASLLTKGKYTPGGNECSQYLDKRNFGANYVHLCFTNNHPMAYLISQEKDIAWLEIDTAILDTPEILYTDGNDIAFTTFRYDNAKALKVLDFKALYTYLDWKIPENHTRRSNAEKYEILVPASIPISMVKNRDELWQID